MDEREKYVVEEISILIEQIRDIKTRLRWIGREHKTCRSYNFVVQTIDPISLVMIEVRVVFPCGDAWRHYRGKAFKKMELWNWWLEPSFKKHYHYFSIILEDPQWRLGRKILLELQVDPEDNYYQAIFELYGSICVIAHWPPKEHRYDRRAAAIREALEFFLPK